LEGFDGDHSPIFASDKVMNKNIVLTTSNDTQCLDRCDDHNRVLIANFADAVLSILENPRHSDITYMDAGMPNGNKAVEDTLCAKYLRNRLNGHQDDYSEIRPLLLNYAGANRLRELGQLDHLEICTQLNRATVLAERTRMKLDETNEIFTIVRTV